MNNDKKSIIVSLVLIALVAVGAYFFVFQKKSELPMAAIKEKAEKFINENLMSPDTQAKIKEIIEENGLYKITVSVGSQNIVSYVTKDGKSLFPQAYDMDQAATGQTNSDQNANQTITKKDVPEVELFVMSYCPYGLQIEKGILPAIELLGSKIKFSLKFVDYVMHGDKEIQENLRQYCIQKEGFAEIDNYLKCFVKQDNSDACLKEAKIDVLGLNSCISATDAQFKITQNAKDKSLWSNGQFPPFDIYKADNTKYNVSGSPTLIINGTKAAASKRDPQSLLSLICSGFSTQPDECSQKVSGDAPSPGFGEGAAAGSNTSGGCSN